jgi:hypothetical protein
VEACAYALRSGISYEDVVIHLRTLVDAFGMRRVMWGSDCKQSWTKHSWADALFCVRESADFTVEEKQWVLGETARTVLRWPRTQAPDGSSLVDYRASTWRDAPQHRSRSRVQDARRG